MLVIGQQRAQVPQIQLRKADQAAGPRAGAKPALVRALDRATAGQRAGLGQRMRQQRALQVRRHAGHARRQHELDRVHVLALMQQLEKGVLHAAAHTAKGRRRRAVAQRAALRVHALAVALHLQLLQVFGQQPQAVGIGHDDARRQSLAVALPQAHQRAEHRQVLRQRTVEKMRVHRRRAGPQFGPCLRAIGQRQAEADGRPQRIAPAHAGVHRRNTVPGDAGLLLRAFRVGGHRHARAGGIHAAGAQPVGDARIQGPGLGGAEGFGHHADQRPRRVQPRQRGLQRGVVEVVQKMQRTARLGAGDLGGQPRPQIRAADADMQQRVPGKIALDLVL